MLILQNKLYYLVLVGSQLQWLFGNKKRVSSRAIYLFHLFWCWAIFSILHTFSGLHPVASYHCGILECLLHHFLYICMHIENANNVERQKMFDPCKSKYDTKIQISFSVNKENIWNLILGLKKLNVLLNIRKYLLLQIVNQSLNLYSYLIYSGLVSLQRCNKLELSSIRQRFNGHNRITLPGNARWCILFNPRSWNAIIQT